MNAIDKFKLVYDRDPSAAISAIAREMGVSRQRAHQLYVKLGLPRRNNTRAVLRNSVEYACWRSMIDRCINRNNRAYKNYGGRGITVCARWSNSYRDFFADMGPRPSPSHSIDRVDNGGNYELSNCRWATKKEQANNRRPRNVGAMSKIDAERVWRDMSVTVTEAQQITGWHRSTLARYFPNVSRPNRRRNRRNDQD